MLTMFAAATAINGTNLWNSGGALYNHHTDHFNGHFKLHLGVLVLTFYTRNHQKTHYVIMVNQRCHSAMQ